MTEKLLQFIWQFRYFNQSELHLESGESLQIIDPGKLNHNQGPDFLEARIRVGNTGWMGHIEIHLRASDWDKHAHTGDTHYNNVILHVVWQNDLSPDREIMPTLCLSGRIPRLLLEKYQEWMQSQAFIPCAKHIQTVNELQWVSWKQRLILERLLRKALVHRDCLAENHSHWEELFWWVIAANFGMRVNSAAFEAIARTLSLSLLARHKNHIHQLEAMLMGQAGMLDGEFADSYPRMLKKEYQFLKNKYQLKPVYHRIHFLRMRPVNFPTIRLSQLAALIHQSTHLFSRIRDSGSLEEVKAWLAVRANDYWQDHYTIDERSPFRIKILGEQMIDNILINTVVPSLFTFGWVNRDQPCKQKALQWLEEIGGEKNAITGGWKKLGFVSKHAADSQALLELKSAYCDKKRCLECALGNALLRKML